MNDLKINDIKGLVTIPDYSFFIYTFLIVVFFCIFIILIFLMVKSFLNRKKTKEQIAFEVLKNLDLKNSKECAYKITKYGRVVITDNRTKKLFLELEEELEKYKYKKNVDNFNKNIIHQFDRFMDAVDV
ncbi:hypothetical protein CP960_04460 [Malaciobacter halophilus]|uniref:DUF4381 domain-containing protein n=1 Tax=Malaciobacter halophilus TaxID=197482 RepID=A0A2N1J4E3_9BACT|nr:hypothetical protein [Malaciobacter halophilus]AXH08982.1 hypothetical protein AHALO_0596 [Malaciobacter halophilus]PKI81342.1 hypothetical protein CP960_04460 [Malaciobacter halophilus]